MPKDRYMFQSPRSGQICSNDDEDYFEMKLITQFQSPRSGQICSNAFSIAAKSALEVTTFQSPRSGQICSNIEIISFTLKM